VGKLCAAYPKYDASLATMTVYYERLRRFKECDLDMAVGRCIDELKFFPKVAEIIDRIKGKRHRQEQGAETSPDLNEAKSVSQKLRAYVERLDAEKEQREAEKKQQERHERIQRRDARNKVLREQTRRLQDNNDPKWIH
jgi:hypothetical protein